MMANLRTLLRQAILSVFSCQTSKERWYVNIPLRKLSHSSPYRKHYGSYYLPYKQEKSSLSHRVFINWLSSCRFYCFILLFSFHIPYFFPPAFCYDAFLVETKKWSYANFVWVDIWENLSSKLLCLLLSYFHSLCKIRIVCLFFVSRWGKIQRWGSPVPGFLILFLTLPFSLVY